MSEITFTQDPAYLEWAVERVGVRRFREDAKTITIMRGGQISGVVVYDTFSEACCHIHGASDGSGHWLTPVFLRTVFAFPFMQLGLRRVTAEVPSRNKAALKFDLHLGFVVEGRCPHAMPDDDVFVLGMLREHCRFIPMAVRAAA